MACVSLLESRQLPPREDEEFVGAIDLTCEFSRSSRACMRPADWAFGLMKEASGKRNSGEGGSGCAVADGTPPCMLDAAVLRLCACFLLENSFSSLSNPLAIVGDPGGSVRNLYICIVSRIPHSYACISCISNLEEGTVHTGTIGGSRLYEGLVSLLRSTLNAQLKNGRRLIRLDALERRETKKGGESLPPSLRIAAECS